MDYCVMCGEPVPEGTWVCGYCRYECERLDIIAKEKKDERIREKRSKNDGRVRLGILPKLFKHKWWGCKLFREINEDMHRKHDDKSE